MTLLSPDCASVKCTACSGDAWDFDADEPAPCACTCHPAALTGDPAGAAA